MKHPLIILAIAVTLSACVAEDDTGTESTPVSQVSSSSVTADQSSIGAEIISSSSLEAQSSSVSSVSSANEVSSSSSESSFSAPSSSPSSSSRLSSSSRSSDAPVRFSSSSSSSSQASLPSSSSSEAPVKSSSSSLSSAQSSQSSVSSRSSASSENEEPAEAPISLTARDLHYSVNLGGSLSVNAANGVMSNDDVAPDVYVELVSEPEHGKLTLNADGSFVYAPTGPAGVDTFIYRITNGNASATAKVSISIHSAESGNNGFTPIAPSADSRLIYISSSEGDDSNDCFSPSTPCASIAEGVKKMREGFPDHVYLKRGDAWRGDGLNGIASGRSVSEPAVVAFYGDSGARPRLENNGTSRLGIRRRIPDTDPRWQGADDTRRKIYLSYVHIIGLEFYNYRLDPSHPEFTGGDASATINLLDDYNQLLFEDNKFNYTKFNAHKFENFIQTNITFRRNIWNGYYHNRSSYTQQSRPSNIYAGVDGLQMIENVLDHGGWHPSVPGAGASMYNHNIYLQEGGNGEHIIIRGNIITRGSSHGIQMRSGGLADDNFFARNAIGFNIGYKDPLMIDGVRAHAMNNVVSEGHSMIKGQDACSFPVSCSGAYWGIDLDTRGGNADWQAHGNIVSSQAPGDTQWQTEGYSLNRIAIGHKLPSTGGIHHRGLDAPHIASSDNISWQWASSSEGEDESYPDPGRTLADYHASLGGAQSFEAFMTVVLNRPLQTWDERYSAYAVNNYIREGFGR